VHELTQDFEWKLYMSNNIFFLLCFHLASTCSSIDSATALACATAGSISGMACGLAGCTYHSSGCVYDAITLYCMPSLDCIYTLDNEYKVTLDSSGGCGSNQKKIPLLFITQGKFWSMLTVLKGSFFERSEGRSRARNCVGKKKNQQKKKVRRRLDVHTNFIWSNYSLSCQSLPFSPSLNLQKLFLVFSTSTIYPKDILRKFFFDFCFFDRKKVMPFFNTEGVIGEYLAIFTEKLTSPFVGY
jgi:hypothetical protein